MQRPPQNIRARGCAARHTLQATLWLGWVLVGVNAWVISQL